MNGRELLPLLLGGIVVYLFFQGVEEATLLLGVFVVYRLLQGIEEAWLGYRGEPE